MLSPQQALMIAAALMQPLSVVPDGKSRVDVAINDATNDDEDDESGEEPASLEALLPPAAPAPVGEFGVYGPETEEEEGL